MSRNYTSIWPLALGFACFSHNTPQSSSWAKCFLEAFSFLLEEM